MNLKRILIAYGGMAIGIISLAVIIAMLIHNQNKLNTAYEIRYKSYSAADELRQSSDDLTRLARTYVATAEDN